MLQIIFAIFFILFSVDSFAQSAGRVPAFLQDEAARSQYIQQQQQQNGSVPAFMQMEQQQYQQQMQDAQSQQNQLQYQSADPTSSSFTLPPAVYQPAQGDTPAFMLQQQPAPENQDSIMKTNKKEDTIQINFSEDQYKPEDEVTTLNKDQANEYNTTVQQEQQQIEPQQTELQEGARFDGEKLPEAQPLTSDAQKAAEMQAQEQNATKEAIPEPEKATTNLLRISYSKEAIDLSEKDKAALLPVVRMLKSSKSNHVLLKAFTSERDIGTDVRKVGLMRVISIREFLMKQGVDFSQTEVKVLDSDLNKEDIDYIDIDKI